MKRLMLFLVAVNVVGCVSSRATAPRVNPGALVMCRESWKPGCDELLYGRRK